MIRNRYFAVLGLILFGLSGSLNPAVAADSTERGETAGNIQPVALVRLTPGNQNNDSSPQDLKRENGYILAYKGIAMLDRSSNHPILVTQCFSLKLNRLVKTYFNWDQIALFQIIDPTLAF